MPKVLNVYRDLVPKESVYIGRPSRWGNPFVVGPGDIREEIVEQYRVWLMSKPELLEAVRTDLRGKDLHCYCAPKACHGDVLLEIANA